MHLDISTPEDEVVRVALEVFRRADAQSDREEVEEMLDAYRAGGLATVGLIGHALWALLSFLTRARASAASLQPDTPLRTREAAEETGHGFRLSALCGPGVVSHLTACRHG